MTREKRRGGPVLFAGLGGFALGAATVLFVVWVYGVGPAVNPGAPGGPAQSAAARREAPPREGAQPPELGGRTRGARGAPSAAPGIGAIGDAGGVGGMDTTPSTAAGAPSERSPMAEPGTDGAQERAPALVGKSPEIADLQQRHLLLPVQGTRREQLVDSFGDGRAGHRHEAIDIMAARNTPVLAVEDGRLTKLFWSQRGGNTIYQFDPGATYAYYYAHLERYADGLHEGDSLHRGQVIGYVGSSGNAAADAPHLHFAIFLLTPEKHWWQGAPIDPYNVLKQP